MDTPYYCMASPFLPFSQVMSWDVVLSIIGIESIGSDEGIHNSKRFDNHIWAGDKRDYARSTHLLLTTCIIMWVSYIASDRIVAACLAVQIIPDTSWLMAQ